MATATATRKAGAAGKSAPTSNGKAKGKGKGKGKTPTAPKLTPREQAVLDRATAEGLRRKLREVPAGPEHDATRATLVAELDAAYTVAVLSLLALAADALSDQDRAYVAEHGVSAVRSQGAAEQRRQQIADVAEKVRTDLVTARKAEAERTARLVSVVFGITEVHKIMSQQALAQRYGLHKTVVSRYVRTGRVAARLSVATSSAGRVQYLHNAVAKASAALSEAAGKDGATFDTVRAALGQTATPAKPAPVDESEPVDVTVSRLASKLTNSLLVLAGTDGHAADTSDGTGEDIMRAVITACDAYARRVGLTLGKGAAKLHAVPAS